MIFFVKAALGGVRMALWGAIIDGGYGVGVCMVLA
jgi:hypothetical protein